MLLRCGILYKENHALDAWLNKAYGGERNTDCREEAAKREVRHEDTGKASLVQREVSAEQADGGIEPTMRDIEQPW